MAAKDILETSLKSAFNSMNSMTSGGNDYLAAQMAQAVDTYVKSLGVAPGSVIISVSGGSGAPAVGVPNPAPIGLTG